MEFYLLSILLVLLIGSAASWIYQLHRQNSELRAYHLAWEKVGGKLLMALTQQQEYSKSYCLSFCALFYGIGHELSWPEKSVDLEMVAVRLHRLANAITEAGATEALAAGGFRALPELTYQQDNTEQRRLEVYALLQHLDIAQLITVGSLLVLNEADSLEQTLLNLHITPLTPAAFD